MMNCSSAIFLNKMTENLIKNIHIKEEEKQQPHTWLKKIGKINLTNLIPMF